MISDSDLLVDEKQHRQVYESGQVMFAATFPLSEQNDLIQWNPDDDELRIKPTEDRVDNP